MEMSGEHLGDFSSDVPYAEGEEQPIQIAALCGLDVLQDLVGKHRSHPLDGHQFVLGQGIDIGRVFDEASLEQNRDPALPQSLDVHHAGEVTDPAKYLGGAGDVRAVAHRLARRADRLATAYGAFLRYAVRLLLARALLEYWADHLRDNIARALDDHRVALTNVLPPNVVLVVKRRLLDNDAADLHRLEDRKRVETPGPADVDSDALELGRRLDRRELVGDGPARLPPDVSKLVPKGLLVDLYHHAVDLVVEVVSAVFPRPVMDLHSLQVLETLDLRVDTEAQRTEPL